MASLLGSDFTHPAAERPDTSRKRRSRERPRPVADPPGAGSLSSLIEGEIIPRMMVAHAARAESDARVFAEDVDALAPLALRLEADALLGLAERMLARGVTVESLLVDLLAPTARRLGEYWEADLCDFVDVTMALWRLQEVVRHVAGGATAAGRPGGGRRALFAAMPGDQHSFGTVVVDEIFRRAGWDTMRLGEAEPSELIGQVAGEWFDLIGITATCERHLPRLRSLIAALRTVSRNPRASVMVGGRIFIDNPALAVNVGADGTARDARAAVAVAAGLVEARARDAIGCG